MRTPTPHLSRLLIVVCGVGACTPQRPAGDTAGVTPQEGVPARAPNFPPPALGDDLVLDANGDRVSTTVLSVEFTVDATQSERQAAVDLVHGTVIGGLNPGGGGRYYVRIDGDGTIETIWQSAHTLNTLHQVALAGPYTVFRGQSDR